jgi:hypothetical protein
LAFDFATESPDAGWNGYWNYDSWAVDQTPVAAPPDAGSDSGALDLSAALSGKTFTYWATTTQQRPDGGMLSRNPTDQDFVPIIPVAKDVVVFADDGSTAQVTSVKNEHSPMTGTRTSTDQGKWSYGLMPPTGGRLTVWLSGTTILASRVLYGSGVPVIYSDRGELRGNQITGSP